VHDRRLQHSDLDDLVEKLRANEGAKRRLIWTTACSRWRGASPACPELVQIARDHDAVLIMDDSHATGVLGETGRGTAEHFGVLGEVDVITSTLGKALGGAAGGFVAGARRSATCSRSARGPQLFSNALPPTVAASALGAIAFTRRTRSACDAARERALLPRAITEAGLLAAAGRDADRADHRGRDGERDPHERHAARRGRVRHGFGFPVVPHGQARVRCQVSADHTRDDLDTAIAAFKKVGSALGII
jgi:glycine C-acetyltransferase